MQAEYVVTEVLHEGRYTVVSRGRRTRDDAPVILKRLRMLFPPPEKLADIRREFDITRLAASDGVIEALDLFEHEGQLQLVFEDVGGQSLAQHFRNRRMGLQEFFDIAIDAVDALAVVHDRHIIHKDINPANLIWNPTTGAVKIIDFGISSVLRREGPSVSSPRRFRGTPIYMSPEQTGRMNVALDHRSDLYSVGAMFYEWLSGRPPFVASDRLALVHAHIAREPQPLHELVPSVPRVLSDLVGQLLQKRAEQRYQSARGIAHDLRECQRRLDQRGQIPEFPLRTADLDDRLHLPQSLYGRESELEVLQAAYRRVTHGANELMLVRGYSGIGKTTLVGELHRSMVVDDAIFVSGKFDQFNRGVPYASLIQAFRGFVRQLMGEDEETVARWRHRILDAVGHNGLVLTDVLHEVEWLIGPQPPVEVVSPPEAQNRFLRTFQRFVACIATAEHPLVLFLDDLQWADLASLALIGSLARSPDMGHLLLIGAFRDNEVGDDHPLRAFLGQLHGAGHPVHAVTLGPLESHCVGQLLADATGRTVDDVSALAELVVRKTGGNPFFINRFLESVHSAGLLRLDPGVGQWAWSLTDIEEKAVTDNVVEFMGRRIGELPDETRHVLMRAAVLGNSFELASLAALLSRSRWEVQSALRAALDEDLLQPMDSDYWERDDADGAIPNFRFRFVHDRIQQAAAAQLEAAERAALHLSVARFLAERPESVHERLFDITEHIGHALDSIGDPDEAERFARLCLQAVERAIRSAAYGPARDIVNRAVHLVEVVSGSRDVELAYRVRLEAARAAYLCGDHAAMDTHLSACLERARDVLERAAAHEIRILAHIGQGALADAIDLALDTIEELGFAVTRAPTPADVERGLVQVLGLVGDWDLELDDRPLMVDARAEAAMRLQVLISSPAYLMRPLLLPILAFNLVRTTVERGISRESPYAFGLLALFLAAVNRADIAWAQGQLALRLLERFDDRALRTRPMHLVHGFVAQWNMPLRDTLASEQGVYYNGVDTGDLEYACWGAHLYLANAFFAGVELPRLGREFATYTAAMTNYQQSAQLNCTIQFAQLVENLTGEVADPAVLAGSFFDETTALDGFEAVDFRGAVFVTCALATKARYLFGDPAGAVAMAQRGHPFADGSAATGQLVCIRFYEALARLQLCDQANQTERAAHLAVVEEHRQMLAVWAGFCAANHDHRIALLDAERARVDGRAAEAADLYAAAVRMAGTQRFVQHAALANELAARFHAGRDQASIARAYLIEARYGYQRWGALTKVAQLDAQFPDLRAASESRWRWTAPDTTDQPQSDAEVESDIDVDSLFRAMQVMSSEMRLEALLEKVIGVAIQNAGATSGYLIMEHDGALRIDAAQTARGVSLPVGGTIAKTPELPYSVVMYVARTGESLVLEDGRDDPRFSDEMSGPRPRSVLCAPVVYKGRRSGIVYLENDLVRGAFTPERIKIINVIATQAAIAIENARLYTQTETMARSFERFVPTEVIRSLGRERITDVSLGDAATHEVTVLFSDLRRFTAMLERLDASAGFAVLNRYLGRMGPVVSDHGGFIDKFIGDAIMALFIGAADRALEAVIAMKRALVEMNDARAFPLPLEMGVGLHAGPVMLGTLGSERRMDVTAIGDTVNSAARIEAATKALGTPVLISEAVVTRLIDPGRFSLRSLGPIRVYGRRDALELVEVFDIDEPAVQEGKRRAGPVFQDALSHYRRGDFAGAVARFRECLVRCPQDTTSAVLMQWAEDAAIRGGGPGKDGVELV